VTEARYACELGIEAASDDASVAVLRGEAVLAVHRWHIQTTASRELLAAIAATLEAAGVAHDAVEAVAVDTGPGGYGSLRTSVATAQGIAVGLDVPLAGVSRLEVAAFPHLAPGMPVVVVHDAGRAGLAWAAFAPCDERDAYAPKVLSAPRLDTFDLCVSLAPRGALWCGDLSTALLAALPGIEGIAVTVDADTGARTGDTGEQGTGLNAADVVRLARIRHAYGDPASVDVTYLRPPSIGARRALG
jgi:tRNA threonylcarbamoyl adenosine modification protein YeaZ